MQKQKNIIKADFLIVGGGTAGLMAGILLKRKSPKMPVVVIEKAHARRSGCLAMGLNAVNLYLTNGNVDNYVNYVKRDSFGIVREDLVRSIGVRANKFVPLLEQFGVPFPRDENGDYLKRSRRSIKMNGEHLKPILYEQAIEHGVEIVSHSPAVKLLQDANGRVIGVAGFSIRTGQAYQAFARAVLMTTGGASGIYRPANPEIARKKTWYCPYNAGAGLAMGLRAGAEVTSFEMRFVALRTKDVIAPTGTLINGTWGRQINARGVEYLKEVEMQLGRKLATCERLFYQIEENRLGRGPCFIDLQEMDDRRFEALMIEYLSMSPCLVLQLLTDPENKKKIEVAGSEPYINGGHGMAGYWISEQRQTTLAGLYAAGDVAGGASKKYITGCFAEAEIAIEHCLDNLPHLPKATPIDLSEVFSPLGRTTGLRYADVESRLQKIMDEYAGGYTMNYATNREKLFVAKDLLETLDEKIALLSAQNPHELLKVHECMDRILLARVLIMHMLARKETRWPVYQTRLDYPVRNDVEFYFFVNSRLRQNEIQVFLRDVRPPYHISELQVD